MLPNRDFPGAIHSLLTAYRQQAAPPPAVEDSPEPSPALAALLDGLGELAGPLAPGAPHTLVFAGLERHDGQAPYAFVVAAEDLAAALHTVRSMPSWQQWAAGQRPMGAPEGSTPDVLFDRPNSHPGVPRQGTYTDLRGEQAAGRLPAQQPELRPEPGTEFPYALSDYGQAAAEALGPEWESEAGYLGASCLIELPGGPLLHLRLDSCGDLLIGPAGGEDEDGHDIELSGVPKTPEQLATAGEQIAAVIRQHWK
ncbi:hypothetical protein [Streptomyces sp. S-2]|uniref:hypothetical protein n=1 Tax=Streptomyces sp. S-2 TaxID=2675217 RepID=UPI001C43DE49|nr:hypothetical protein [Streptomyces sp. S-2]MBV7255135.1 hypothetical protein [Streptomyces sp. S-2]